MTFIEWVQYRLNVHGADPKLSVDGDWGALTRLAMASFQKSSGLRVTRIADKATVAALRNPPGSAGLPDGVGHGLPDPAETMPPWLAEMTRRMGLHERSNNKTLSDWLMIGKYLGNPAKLPWCGDAIETCFVKTLPDEPLPSNPFWAQAWAKFGKDTRARVGAVGVIRWSAKSGHVGIVAAVERDRIMLRGGNQSDMIKDSWFPRSKFMAFRWPQTFQITDYPSIKAGDVSAAGFSETR
ncbi:MAG: peptidoglycan-binding protein [Nitratireductor sp.]|nr:peptidoglycan-binding protein [Nitratireductor sp.]